MRLIDADDVNNHGVGYVDLSDCPTIDAVEVIRCRDCEWYKTHYTWDGKERKVCGIEPFEPIRQEEDYCSYGERRE